MTEIVVLVHNIRSTFNVGSILRTSDGLGVDKVIFSGYTPYPEVDGDVRLPHERDKITAQIAKTALGAEKTVPFGVSDDVIATISDLKAIGYRIVALEQAKNSTKLADFQPIGKIALLLGEEVEGIDQDLLKLADKIVEIPMLGQKESLNVSVAYAMAIWEIRRTVV